MLSQFQNIGKPNNLKVFGSKTNKGPEQDSQNLNFWQSVYFISFPLCRDIIHYNKYTKPIINMPELIHLVSFKD